MAKASKTAKKTAAPAKKIVRSAAATQVKQQTNPETSTYQVLAPFWLGGDVVKPTAPNGAPVFIEMTAAEAAQYQDAGVLGTEPGDVPGINSDDQNGGQDATNAGGTTDGA